MGEDVHGSDYVGELGTNILAFNFLGIMSDDKAAKVCGYSRKSQNSHRSGAKAVEAFLRKLSSVSVHDGAFSDEAVFAQETCEF